MQNDTPQHLDECATIDLAQVRETLRLALAQYGGDVALRRALTHAAGAVDDCLGQPRELLNRSARRGMR
jgi:hypothetical protein